VLWFDEHIRPKLSHFVNANQKPIKVHITLPVAAHSIPRKRQGAPKKNNSEQDLSFQIYFEEIDHTASLDNFQVSEENKVAYGVLEELCNKRVFAKVQAMSAFSPQPAAHSRDFFNPIYIYGPSGAGKTHLLMAVAQKLCRVGYKVLYARAELFTEHVV